MDRQRMRDRRLQGAAEPGAATAGPVVAEVSAFKRPLLDRNVMLVPVDEAIGSEVKSERQR